MSFQSSSSSSFKSFPKSNAVRQTSYLYSRTNFRRAASSQEPVPIHFEQVTRKYFGSKLHLSFNFKTNSERHTKHDYKYLRKFRFPPPANTRTMTSQLERLCFFTKQIPNRFDCLTFNKIVSACKHLNILEINQDGSLFNFKNIKKMRGLKTLLLNLHEDQIQRNSTALRELKSLQKVSISLDKQDASKSRNLGKNIQIAKFSNFYKQLIQLPRLKTLNLNIQDSENGKHPAVLEDLLENLAHSKIHQYFLQVKMTKSDGIDLRKIEKTLEQLDFLSLKVVNTTTRFIVFDGINLVLPGSVYKEETARFIEEGNKGLEINYKDLTMLDLGLFLNQCSSLKSLGLHFGNSDASLSLPQDISFVQSFKNLVLSFEGLGEERITETLQSLSRMLKGMRTIESVSFLFIFSKLKDEAMDMLCLLHQILLLNPVKDYAIEFREKFKFHRSKKSEEVLESLSKQLVQMKALESLRIEAFVHGITSLTNTKNMLVSLKQLKKLHFSLKSEMDSVPCQISFLFPLSELTHLQELRLRLKINLTKQSVLNFIENIGKMNELEILEIMEGTLQVSVPLFVELLNAFEKMEKLREVTMDIRIFESENSQISGDEVKIGRLKKVVEEYFNRNKKLKLMCITFMPLKCIKLIR